MKSKFILICIFSLFQISNEIAAQNNIHAEKVLNESNNLIYNGNFERAEQILESEIEVFQNKKLEDEEVFRLLLVEYSSLSLRLHNYLRANSYISYAKALFEKNQDFGSGYIHCLSTFAQVQYYSKDYVWAKIFIDTAINMARKQWKDQLSKLGNTKESFFTCDNFISMLSTASLIYSEIGCNDEAIVVMKEAINYVKETNNSITYPYHQLALLYTQEKQYLNAIEYFKKSINDESTASQKIESKFALCICYFLINDYKNACNTAVEASSLLQREIKSNKSFLSDSETEYYWRYYKQYYPLLNMILCNSNEKNVSGYIYNNCLEYKAFRLRSYLQMRHAIKKSHDEKLMRDFEELLSLRRHLNSTSLDKTYKSYDRIISLEKELSKATSSLPAYLEYNKNWEDVRDRLQSDEIAIEFLKIPVCNKNKQQEIYSEDCFFALIVDKELKSPMIVKLCSTQEISKTRSSDFSKSSPLLYNLIWSPLEPFIKDKRTIYFCPEDDLYTIAIENLFNDDKKLIQQGKNLVRVSSTRSICFNQEQNSVNKIALFGGIKYSVDQSKDLSHLIKYKPTRSLCDSLLVRGTLDDISQGTLHEVENINRIIISNDNKSTLYSGVNASEENFKQISGQDYDVIHIATHGFYWSKEHQSNKSIMKAIEKEHDNEYSNAMQGLNKSGLLFAGAKLKIDGSNLPDDVDDGILCASEIENLDLSSVDFVVLSACQTGLGYIEPEEGVFGLQRAFKKAGVKSILMTLWKVDDEATQLFMTHFYSDYLNSKSKQHALKSAQNYLRMYKAEDGELIYSGPYYWAGFVLLDAFN